MIPVNRAKTRGQTGGPEVGGGDPKFGALTMTIPNLNTVGFLSDISVYIELYLVKTTDI